MHLWNIAKGFGIMTNPASKNLELANVILSKCRHLEKGACGHCINDSLDTLEKETIERCAKVAEDEMIRQRRILKPYTLAAGTAAEEIAQAIRSLKGKEDGKS